MPVRLEPVPHSVSSQALDANALPYVSMLLLICQRIFIYIVNDEPLKDKDGKMPANKHICHASGFYQEMMANSGKYWQI